MGVGWLHCPIITATIQGIYGQSVVHLHGVKDGIREKDLVALPLLEM